MNRVHTFSLYFPEFENIGFPNQAVTIGKIQVAIIRYTEINASKSPLAKLSRAFCPRASVDESAISTGGGRAAGFTETAELAVVFLSAALF